MSTNDQEAEHPANDVVEQLPIDHEHDELPADNNDGNNDDEVSIDNNNGIPRNPNDPMLPPRVRRELNQLANDGVAQPYTKDGHEAKHNNPDII